MFAANYTGGQLVYPLYYDYPEDETALDNIEDSYMLGDAIKISPRIDPIQEGRQPKFQSYFPKGIWRDLNDYRNMVNASSGGKWVELSKIDGMTQIHLKEGKVIP